VPLEAELLALADNKLPAFNPNRIKIAGQPRNNRLDRVFISFSSEDIALEAFSRRFIPIKH